MEDVADSKPALGEAARYQETAMTVQRLALRAHDTDTRSRRRVEQAAEACLVFGPCRHGFVVGDAVAIKAVIARPAAERLAHRRIADPGCRQGCGKLLL